MKPWLLAAACALLVGCRTSSQWREQYNAHELNFYWGRNTLLLGNSPPVPVPSEDWCKDLTNRTLSVQQRRKRAAMLFGACVQPGFTTQDMRRAIPDPTWLKECKVEPVGGIAGYSPLCYPGYQFTVDFFPDDEGHSDWQLWFTLGTEETQVATSSNAVSFLEGSYPDKRLRITEFVLFYQLPGTGDRARVEERHSPRGVGIKFWLYGWYDAL
jgi:hypothetical protein